MGDDDLFPIRVWNDAAARKRTFEALRLADIDMRVHDIPVSRLLYRVAVSVPHDTCPHTQKLCSRLDSSPVFPDLSGDDVDCVVEELGAALS